MAGSVLDTFRLDGRVAVVTGGNRGLGRAFAQALAEAGAAVAIAARDGARSEAVAEELARDGARVIAVPADVTDRDSVRAMTERVTDALGPVDVLVNNAGVCFHRPALEVPAQEWRAVFDVNVDGLWHCSTVVGEQMVGRGTRLDREHRLDLRPDRQPAADAARLQRVQGGGAPAHEVARRRVGDERRTGQRARAGLRQDGDGAGRPARVQAPLDRRRADAALRPAGGDRARAGVPGQRRVGVHDGLGARRSTAATRSGEPPRQARPAPSSTTRSATSGSAAGLSRNASAPESTGCAHSSGVPVSTSTRVRGAPRGSRRSCPRPASAASRGRAPRRRAVLARSRAAPPRRRRPRRRPRCARRAPATGAAPSAAAGRSKSTETWSVTLQARLPAGNPAVGLERTRSVDLHPVAAAVLGSVEHPVGRADEIRRVRRVVGQRGDAEAEAVTSRSSAGKSSAAIEPHPLGDDQRAVAARVGQQQHELLAADARDEVASRSRP